MPDRLYVVHLAAQPIQAYQMVSPFVVDMRVCAGDKMLESEAVRKIGFTGSTNVGKTLMAGAAQTVKKVSLELGGNAPYIIFDDADIELAATGVVTSAFRNAGQTCICANKILVQVSISHP